jgi:hypothetical protein
MVALMSLLTMGNAATPASAPPQRQADFRVEIRGEVSAEFRRRIDAYAELRSTLERGLPPRRVTDDAEELVLRIRRLQEKLKAARRSAKQGDIFVPEVTAAFRNALQAQTDTKTCTALFDDNPVELHIGINDVYPTHQPVSSMPPNVLAALPRLPDDIEYRFVGRDLILFDTRARMLVDRMTLAVRC